MLDGSMRFPLGPDRRQNVNVSLPMMIIDSRAYPIGNERYQNLADLNVFGFQNINATLDVLNLATPEVSGVLATLDRVLAESELPAGSASLFPWNETRLVGDEDSVFPLEAGDWVGPDSMWSCRGVLNVAGLEFNSWNVDSRFLGIEFGQGTARHYGWLEIGLTADSGVFLKRAAFESVAGRPIQVTFVPEPIGIFMMFGTSAWAAARGWSLHGASGRHSARRRASPNLPKIVQSRAVSRCRNSRRSF